MAHSVEFKNSARKSIAALPEDIKIRVISAVMSLADNPRPSGCKKVRSLDSAYRIRVGDYRIIYEVYDTALIVIVIRIAHRREVYE